MAYEFEDSTQQSSMGGLGDGGSVETSAELTRGGVPRWMMAILGLAAAVLFVIARGNLPSEDAAPAPTTSPSLGFATTTTPSAPTTSAAEDANQPLVTSQPNQLTHQDMVWPLEEFGGIGRAVAIRQGSSVLVIDPENDTSHRIELPVTASSQARAEAGRDGRSMALVAGKLIVHEERFLRSISTTGGVDLLLSNSSLGFEVATPTAIVAATEVISSSTPVPEIRLVPQGVHFPSARDQVVEVFGEPDLDLLPAGSEVTVVDDKIFVRLNGEIHRKTDDGLVSLGSRRVFAASQSAAIVERCVALFENCSYFRINLQDLSRPEVALDVPLSFSSSSIVMSDDGFSLLVLDDGSETQTLVDVSTGEWNVAHQFSGEPFTAAAFDSVSGSWVMADAESDSLMFWSPGAQTFWQLPIPGAIDEIAIAQQVS